MATVNDSKLKSLYTRLAPGAPLTISDLAKIGISADLAVHYVRSGWLTRLARGVYSRPRDPLGLAQSLVVLERTVSGLHVGGKTALGWYGIRQYVAHRPSVHLYGWSQRRLPVWFTRHFPSEYHRKRIFKEEPTDLLYAGRFEHQPDAPHVSEPERAILEILSEVGIRQPLQEARELLESTYTLRAEVLAELLKACTNIKTVRLCLRLGSEVSAPWLAKLDPADLPTGSNKPWVSRSPDGVLVLKP